ncbi:hypothetical protein FRB93_006147 [Tulasnella sp. JGI-2019a]|nr:hypothetical protein FRB93_006147 [Tulasnella sp. JGI-2019a]
MSHSLNTTTSSSTLLTTNITLNTINYVHLPLPMSIDTVQVEECITLQQEEQEVMQSIDPDSVTFSGPSLTGTQVQLRVC